MLRLFFSASFLFSSPAAPKPDLEPMPPLIKAEKKLELEKFYTLSKSKERLLVRLSEEIKMRYAPANNPQIPPKILGQREKTALEEMLKAVKWDDYKKAVLSLVDLRFSLEELQELNDLLSKPVMIKLINEDLDAAGKLALIEKTCLEDWYKKNNELELIESLHPHVPKDPSDGNLHE